MNHKTTYFPWDISPENEICYSCSRSGSNQKMCSWIRSLVPVPGWIAIDSSEMETVISKKILRCPLFLESIDDPGLSQEEYSSLCHNVIVEFYRKMLEYMRINSELRKECMHYKERISELEAKLSSPIKKVLG